MVYVVDVVLQGTSQSTIFLYMDAFDLQGNRELAISSSLRPEHRRNVDDYQGLSGTSVGHNW